ncbi:hypothetical protein ADEAN_000306600 [Angomonas deanei]|uniref:Uncharacterized protein n=1 Tax=Angomonas deanei TaxID=59799 RepID=A0A7G2C989_9TRYP|nr:hypothetical protein ADEAN_000306600 [Angomonas deanei]
MFFSRDESPNAVPTLSDSNRGSSDSPTTHSQSQSSYDTRYSSSAARSSSSGSAYSTSTTGGVDKHVYNQLQLELDLRNERIKELESTFEDLKRTSDYAVGTIGEQLKLKSAQLEALEAKLAGQDEGEDRPRCQGGGAGEVCCYCFH